MNRRILTLTVSLAVLISVSFAAETTTETANPFNEFMKPNGGVDLFSGSVAFTLPIHSLPGRNGMDVALKLRYSSNVYTQVRGRNDIAQTSWTGLGWALGFGSIRTEHQNTIDPADDRYFWVSPEGVQKELIGKELADGSIKYYIEDNPYWKVERIDETRTSGANEYTVTAGWVLTDTKGKKHVYGNPHKRYNSQESVRNIFCWPASYYVGEGFGGTPELFPHQWDLAAVSDLFGNTITYWYDQDRQVLDCSGSKAYTKASYLKTILLPGGNKYEFELEKRNPDEYYDPHTLAGEPDNFIELFQVRRLKTIRAYLDDRLVREYLFCFAPVNVREDASGGTEAVKAAGVWDWMKAVVASAFGSLAEGLASGSSSTAYEKPLLTTITEKDKDGQILNQTICEYNSDNFGALSAIQHPRCGRTEFSYEEVPCQATVSFDEQSDHRDSDHISGGTWKDGTPYFMLMDNNSRCGPEGEQWTKNCNRLSLRTWTGTNWEHRQTRWENELKGRAAPGYIITMIADEEDHGSWRMRIGQRVISPRSGNYIVDLTRQTIDLPHIDREEAYGGIYDIMTTQRSYFVVVSAVDRVHKYSVFSWNGREFYKAKDWSQFDTKNFIWGENFFVVYPDGEFKEYTIYTFDSRNQVWKGETHDEHHEDILALEAGPNYILSEYKPGGKEYFRSYNWNGEEWVDPNGLTRLKQGRALELHGGRNFFVVNHRSVNEISAFNWNGTKWEEKLERVNTDVGTAPRYSLKMGAGNEYFTALYPMSEKGWGCNRRYDNEFEIYRWDGSEWYSSYNGKAALGTKNQKTFTNGIDLFVALKTRNHYRNPVKDIQVITKTWNGSEWIHKQIMDRDIGGGARQYGVALRPNNGALGISVRGHKGEIKGDDRCGGNWSAKEFLVKKSFFMKQFRDRINALPKAWVCHKKAVKDLLSGDEYLYKYAYGGEGARTYLSTHTGSAMHGKVKVSYPDGSRVSYTLDNASPVRLGKITGIQESSAEESVGSTKETAFTFNYHVQPDWPDGVGYLQSQKKTIIQDNLKTETVYKYSTEGSSGGQVYLPNPTEEQVSAPSGRKAISRYTYAHQVYEKMSTLHMLDQVAGIELMDGSGETERIENATVTTWRSEALNVTGNEIMVRDREFTWEGENGPVDVPVDFSYDNPDKAPGQGWITNTRYSEYTPQGMLREAENNPDVENPNWGTTLYGHDETLPIAIVQNARAGEVSIYTGDYNDGYINGDDRLVDRDHGWVADGDCAIDEPPAKHFAEKTIHIKDGISLESTVEDPASTKTYVFGAWVYPGTAETKTVKLEVLTPDGTPILTKDASFGNLEEGKWNYVSRQIAGEEIGESAVLRVSGDETADFYIEDIRFHPHDALVTTMYYHPDLKKKTATVDANLAMIGTDYDKYALPNLEFRRDAEGNVTKLSETERLYAKCPTDYNEMKAEYIKVSQAGMHFDPNRKEYAVYIPGEVGVVSVMAKAQSPYDRASIDGYTSECPCSEEQAYTRPRGMQTVTPVSVGIVAPDGTVGPVSGEYKVNLKWLTNCFNYAGEAKALERGTDKVDLVVKGDVPYMAYIDQETGKAVVASLVNEEWTITGSEPLTAGAADVIDIAVENGSAPVVAATDSEIDGRCVVKRYHAGDWVKLGTGQAITEDTPYEIDLEVGDAGDRIVLAYTGDMDIEQGLAAPDEREFSSVFVKQYNEDLDNWSFLQNNQSAAITPEAVSSMDLDLTDDGDPYLAYVYARNEEVDEQVSDDLQGNLYVLGFSTENGWQRIGTEAIAKGPAKNISMSAVAPDDIYVAYTERISVTDQEEYDMLGKPAYRAVMQHWNGQEWTFVKDEDETDPTIYYDVGGENFKMFIRNHNPHLVFGNFHNFEQLSVIEHRNGRWRSFGNPGFAKTVQLGANCLAVGQNNSGYPVVSYENARNNNEISVMQYRTPCVDGVLEGLSLALADGSSLQMYPRYRPYILNYASKVEPGGSSIVVKAEPPQGGIVAIDGKEMSAGELEVQLSVGYNAIPVEVTTDNNGDGEVDAFLAYNIVVFRPPTSHASLCGFNVYDPKFGELPYSPSFDASALTYHVDEYVPHSIDAIIVEPTVTNKADIQIGNYPTVPNYPSSDIKLEYGNNEIPIVVTAPDGSYNRVYTLNVNREVDPELALENITFSSSSGSIPLDFDPNVLEYEIELNNAISSISASGTFAAPALLNGEPWEPGTVSDDIALAPGRRNFVIVSLGAFEDRSRADYVFQFLRAPGVENKLETVEIEDLYGSEIAFNQAFDPSVLAYSTEVDYETAELRITPAPGDENATAFVGGEEYMQGYLEVPLEIGNNSVEIEVEPADGGGNAVYVFEIHRKPLVHTPAVSFEHAKSELDEGGQVRVRVMISHAPTGPVTLSYRVGDESSATEGSDFTIEGDGTLEFDVCEAYKDIVVNTRSGDGHEQDETIVLHLTSPIGATLGGTRKHTITLRDVDDAFTVGFIESEGSGPESEEWVQIPVAINRLHNIDEPSSSVDYTVRGLNGAVAGEDFVLANGTLTWGYCGGGCGTVENIVLQILQDGDIDPGEQVEITLSNPQNCVIDESRVYVYSIDDHLILYVGADHGYPKGNDVGLSWEKPYRYLQDALSEAMGNALVTEIRVAEGIYYPDEGEGIEDNDREASFKLVSGLSLIGGYPAAGGDQRDLAPSTLRTVLDGNIAAVTGGGTESYTVIQGASDCKIDGFVIRNGSNDRQIHGSQGCGGGMVAVGCTDFEILNCVFEDNFAYYGGGAIFFWYGSPAVRNCRFVNNNIASNTFTLGTRDFSGGGAVLISSGDMMIENCRFLENTSWSSGGALHFAAEQEGNTGTVRNCIFNGNLCPMYCYSIITAVGVGGGIFVGNRYYVNVSNCSFYHNEATFGGGVAVYNGGVSSILNTIISDNRACNGPSVSVVGRCTIANSCLWGGFESIYKPGDLTDGGFNIDDSPFFIDDDLNIDEVSPCIDRGTNQNAPTYDIDGNARYDHPAHENNPTTVDIGAHEYTP